MLQLLLFLPLLQVPSPDLHASSSSVSTVCTNLHSLWLLWLQVFSSLSVCLTGRKYHHQHLRWGDLLGDIHRIGAITSSGDVSVSVEGAVFMLLKRMHQQQYYRLHTLNFTNLQLLQWLQCDFYFSFLLFEDVLQTLKTTLFFFACYLSFCCCFSCFSCSWAVAVSTWNRYDIVIIWRHFAAEDIHRCSHVYPQTCKQSKLFCLFACLLETVQQPSSLTTESGANKNAQRTPPPTALVSSTSRRKGITEVSDNKLPNGTAKSNCQLMLCIFFPINYCITYIVIIILCLRSQDVVKSVVLSTLPHTHLNLACHPEILHQPTTTNHDTDTTTITTTTQSAFDLWRL